MVTASFLADAALRVASSELVAAYFRWRRAGPGEPDARAPQIPLGTLETCPAECPAPSLHFCVCGPLEELLLPVSDVVLARPLLAVAVVCSLAGLAVGFLIGRCAAAPRLRRPHGRRPGPAVHRGRG